MTHTNSITSRNLHIEGSSLMSKDDVRAYLDDAIRISPCCLVWLRSRFSLMMEWATHKVAYKLGYKVERTESVDLNYPQKWWEKICYPIVGILAWIFV